MSDSISSVNLQRVGPLSSIPGLLRRFGANPMEVLAAAGLSAAALDDPEATIPYSAAGLLLEAAAGKTRCPHFGLEAGKQIRTTSLGLIGELMRNAPTLGVALHDFVTNQHRNAHGSVAYLLEDKHNVLWGDAVYHPHIHGYHLICDFAAMQGFELVCELAGADHKHTIEVLFSRSDPQDLEPYYRAFGVKLRFNAEQTALLLPRPLLDHPVMGADASLRSILEKRVSTLWSAGGLDIVTELRRILRVALIGGQVSVNQISGRMGMSRRTLYRRLDACGLHFREVLEETRCEFAQQLLANTQLSISAIATIVGYADPSILTRGFVRWTGLPPSKWRLHIDTTRPGEEGQTKRTPSRRSTL